MFKEFPILYAKNKNGVWKQWMVSVRKEEENGFPVIEVSHGQKGGKQIMASQTITEKKRGHETLWDQAVSVAQSKWNHKHDRENYMTTMDETNKVLSPMLAKAFEGGKHLRFPLYVQPKLDGLRCLAHPDGLYSRTGCLFLGLDFIKNDLKRYFEKNEGFVVDGELYSDEMSFEELSGCCRRQKTDQSSGDDKKVFFHVFDVIPPTSGMVFQDRLNYFPEETENIRLVPTFEITKKEDIEKNLKKFIKEGYEGVIIRNKDGVYQVGHRSWDLQKYKLFQEEEFVITGSAEGIGKEKGLVIWECQTKDGRKFNVRPEGGHDTRRKLFRNASAYIGKNLTVVFQEYTKDGVPRFPVGKAVREHY